MFASAREAAKSKVSSKGISSDEVLTLPPQCKSPLALVSMILTIVTGLPERYSLSQLYDGLELSNESKSKEVSLYSLLVTIGF